MNAEQIETKVKEIRTTCGAESIPVDIFKILSRESIELYETTFKDPEISATIINDNGEYSIHLNREHSPRRKLFSIAHELGHYYLHMKDNEEIEGYIDWDGTEFARSSHHISDPIERELEKEANRFAASLLMPQEAIEDFWRSVSDVQKLATIFRVSVPAISIRLQSLGLLDL